MKKLIVFLFVLLLVGCSQATIDLNGEYMFFEAREGITATSGHNSDWWEFEYGYATRITDYDYYSSYSGWTTGGAITTYWYEADGNVIKFTSIQTGSIYYVSYTLEGNILSMDYGALFDYSGTWRDYER